MESSTGGVREEHELTLPARIAALEDELREREHFEAELRAANERLSSTIELLPDPTFLIDCDKKVIAWNHATEELTGVTKEQILGQGDYVYALPFFGKRRPILIDLVDVLWFVPTLWAPMIICSGLAHVRRGPAVAASAEIADAGWRSPSTAV